MEFDFESKSAIVTGAASGIGREIAVRLAGGGAAEALPPSAYLAALVVVLVNLAFLARAGWDL
jgi:NAD(P)-dependent dehydrogenase (short-subunit alcohol dehydrogenase family)